MSIHPDPVTPPLQEQLDEITANTRALVPPERLTRLEQVIHELRSTRIEDHQLAVGAMAPLFSLKTAAGKSVCLADLLALGPVILKFFRGRWDAYDMTELELWQTLLPELRSHRAIFIAISPQTGRQNEPSRQIATISPFLCSLIPHAPSPHSTASPTPSLSQPVPYFRSILVNIPFLNGDETWTLPLPATFVLRAEGSVCFAQGFADHRLRPEPREVMTALCALAGS